MKNEQPKVLVDYELFKTMEYELAAIKNKRAYIVRDLWNATGFDFVIGGIEPNLQEVIESIEKIKDENYKLKQIIKNYDKKIGELETNTIKKWREFLWGKRHSL